MIRNSSIDDCGEVYELICDMENKRLPYDDFSRIFRSQQADENYQCLIYEKDGEAAGFINLRYEYQLHHDERIAEIMEFVVNSKCRGSGLGKELFDKACETARDNGCSQIEVACNQLRKDTHRFYERHGMNNFHYKFSMRLDGSGCTENKVGV